VNRWRVRLIELEGDIFASSAHVQNVQIVQKPLSSEHFEQIEQSEPISSAQDGAWSDVQEERAAIVEYDGGVPRPWAEALARLDPNKPPADVPAKRWLRFIDDCGRFLDGRWPAEAADFGWGPLDLFGCDRERPYGRVDRLGLLWLVNGGAIVELHRDRAVLKSASGAPQTYRRRPVEVGRVVLAWELADAETPKRRAINHGTDRKT
jgi:hypothetical protein